MSIKYYEHRFMFFFKLHLVEVGASALDRPYSVKIRVILGIRGLEDEKLIKQSKPVERGICPIAAVCTVLLSSSRDRDHAHFSEIFVRGHIGTIPGKHACQI